MLHAWTDGWKNIEIASSFLFAKVELDLKKQMQSRNPLHIQLASKYIRPESSLFSSPPYFCCKCLLMLQLTKHKSAGASEPLWYTLSHVQVNVSGKSPCIQCFNKTTLLFILWPRVSKGKEIATLNFAPKTLATPSRILINVILLPPELCFHQNILHC